MRTRSLALLALAASLSACGSYKSDLEKICNAPALAGNPSATSVADVGAWLDANVRTKKGRALLGSLRGAGSADVALLEARANGIAPCPLLDPHVVNGGVQIPAVP